MPEYLSPGVYMEEFEIGARPIEGVSTSTAGFLGETERGPTTPRLVTSWLQFQRIYGGYFGTDKYLPGSVEGFFKNGGSRCYIARIVKSTTAQEVSEGVEAASSAYLNMKSIDELNPGKLDEFNEKILRVEAIGEGEWGKRIAVMIDKGTESGIKLNVFYWKTLPSTLYNPIKDLSTQPRPSVAEIFDNISINEISSDYFEKAVNGISNLITISIKENDASSSEFSKIVSRNSILSLVEGTDGGRKNKSAETASLTIQSIDSIDSNLSDENKVKILKVTAIQEGKDGNKLGLKIDKGNESGIKLEVFSDTTATPPTSEGSPIDNIKFEDLETNFNGETGASSKLIKISIQKNDYQKASTEILKLNTESGSPTASLKIQSIDLIDCEQLGDYKGKILKVTAIQEGNDGNKLGLNIDKGNESGIKLEVFSDTTATPPTSEGSPIENIEFEDLETKFNGEIGASSKLIKLSIQKNDYQKASKKLLKLEGGKNSEKNTTLLVSDYLREDSNTPGERKGLTAFTEIEDISIVYVPNVDAIHGLDKEIISHCESLRYRFAILDAPNDPTYSKFDPRSGKPFGSPTDHAAFYCPWIKIINPETGLLQDMPPGGYVAGIYARSDTERGVHKAPANEIVKGASDLKFQIMKGEQDVLNPRGVNVIRAFSGRGILVWGARTLSSNTLWKYINVRRLFIYVEASIEKGTQWVVFEPNDDRLWGRVKATITQFLTGVWRSGALMGTTPEEAFFVKCDRSTMTQDDIDNGRLICIIGIAPVKPAEFVIFRIAQWQGGSAATD